MNATERKFTLKRALLRVLADCLGFPVTEPALREACAIKADYLQPTVAEIDAQLAELENEKLCVARATERGRKYAITDAGTLWLDANR